MGLVIKKWSDETKGASYIEHLTFPSDRKWTTCKVTVTGKQSSQSVDVNVDIGGTKYSFSCTLKKNESKTMEYTVGGKFCAINITGKLSTKDFFYLSGAEVLVECVYEESEILKSKSVSWGDSTLGVSCIEKLYLDATEKWEHCEIKVQGLKNKITGAKTTVIVDGELKGNPSWKVLTGTESIVYTYDNINAKVTLLVAGYITNNMGPGGGANIILTGFYK